MNVEGYVLFMPNIELFSAQRDRYRTQRFPHAGHETR